MTSEDYIKALFCQVDDHMKIVPNHCQAALWPSALVTIGLLFVIQGISNHRWIVGGKWRLAVNHLGHIIGWV